MARVTVEDCIGVDKVNSRFELVLLAAKRASQIANGAPLTIDRDRDKNPVVALREIAKNKLDLNELKQSLIKGHQKAKFQDDDEEILEFLDEESSMLGNISLPMGASDSDDDDGETDELVADEEDGEEGFSEFDPEEMIGMPEE